MGDYKYRVTGPKGGKYLTTTRKEAEKLTKHGGSIRALGQKKASKVKNPRGGYNYWLTYDFVTEESAKYGDALHRGYYRPGWGMYPSVEAQAEHDDAAFNAVNLPELVQEVESVASWGEWSSSQPGPGDWLSSHEESGVTDDDGEWGSLTLGLHIERADGKPLTVEEMKYIHDNLGVYGPAPKGKPHRSGKRNPSTGSGWIRPRNAPVHGTVYAKKIGRSNWRVEEQWRSGAHRWVLTRTGKPMGMFNTLYEAVDYAEGGHKARNPSRPKRAMAAAYRRRAKKHSRRSNPGHDWAGQGLDFGHRYLDTFFAEKDLPIQTWTVKAPNGTAHVINSQVVLEHVAMAGKDEQDEISRVIRKIDFANGDVNHFLHHLAGAIAANYASDIF